MLAATSGNLIQAMDARTGTMVWQTNLGPLVPPMSGRCSTGVDTGVLGTPVIDPVAGVLYVTTYMLWQGQPQHMIFAVSLQDGAVVPGWPVNVAAGAAASGLIFDPKLQAQRPGLTLFNGTLYVPFGSNSGECGAFHGWVVGVDVAAARVSGVWRTSALKGGIWGQGGVVSDGRSLFVTTGNTSGTNTWNDGEAVFRLRPDLLHSNDPHDYFAPANWLELDRLDLDMGSTASLPIDVPQAGGGVSKWLLQLGKDGSAYVLDRANLGGLGGSLSRFQVAYPKVATAPVAYPAADGVMVAFTGNGADCPPPAANIQLTVIKVQSRPAPAISTAWCAALAAQGAPIVTTTNGAADPIVWIVGAIGDGRLHGYAGDTGQELFAGGTAKDHMTGVRRFETILYAQRRFYVGGFDRVYSFTYVPGL